MGFKGNSILHQDVSRGGFNGNVPGGVLHRDVSGGGSMVMSKGVSFIEMCPEGFNGNVLRGCPTSRCVQTGFIGNVRGSVSRGGPK